VPNLPYNGTSYDRRNTYRASLLYESSDEPNRKLADENFYLKLESQKHKSIDKRGMTDGTVTANFIYRPESEERKKTG
jgi:hypothetical protein